MGPIHFLKHGKNSILNCLGRIHGFFWNIGYNRILKKKMKTRIKNKDQIELGF